MTRIVAALSLLFMLFAQVQSVAQEERSVRAVRFPRPPAIDGRPDEEAWGLAEPIEDFIQFKPRHGEPSPLRTVVRIGFDDDALYVAFTCYDPEPDGIAAALTQRDSDLRDDDAVVVFLDTFNDDSSCTGFVTNLLGTQWDLRLADNGRTGDSTWDAAWSCAAARFDEGWTAEFAIPFRILKFRGGADRTWGLNLGRTYPRRLEKSYWVGPLDDEVRVSQFGELTGLDLRAHVRRFEIIPYALTQLQQGESAEWEAGLDLRYRLSSTLGAEMTLNPDFATVEADVEEVNLTRFEMSIPEKRPFFLEGAEMFSQRVQQFYSRRVGDIPWGAKLTGRIGGWDLAAIGAQSEPIDGGDGPDATYTVLRAKRSLFGGSNIGFLAANRRWLGADQGSVGVDATLFFTDTLGMTAQFIRAHGPSNDGATAWFVRPAYDSANTHFHVRYSHWGEGLMENMNAVGFIRDDDRREFDTNLSHQFWLNRAGIEVIDARVNYNRYWSQAGVLRSWVLDADVDVTLTSKWVLSLYHNDEFKLYEKGFRNRLTEFYLEYDTRTGSSAQVYYIFGRNFDSDVRMYGVDAELNISGAWNVSYGLTRLLLDPDPEGESTFIHVLRSSYYLNPNLFFKLFFQTNTSIDKRNVQAVLVWRFLPPFGALQVAYQRGTSRFGTRSDQGHTLFTKFSWVF